MKIIFRLSAIAICLLAAVSVSAQTASADSLARKIFATLQAKDQKAFMALNLNPQQFGRFMRTVMEMAFKSEEMQAMLGVEEETKKMNVDSLIDLQVATFSSPMMAEKMEAEIGETFQKIIEKGEKKGVNWAQATLTGVALDSSVVKDDNAEAYEKLGIKEASGVIDFSVGDSAYQIAFNEMLFLKSEGGWFGASFSQPARKGESLSPDKNDFAIDSITTAEKPSKAGKPSPAQPKTKKPAAKAGQGSKSPARKTKARA